MIDVLSKVNVQYHKADPKDGVFKQYKSVPNRYRSNFNKISLVQSSYDIFCEPLDLTDYQSVYASNQCDYELLNLAMQQSIRKHMESLWSSSYYQYSR